MNDCPEIAMSKIDTDDLENVEANREAIQFKIRLCDKPSEIWRQEFEAAYRETPYVLKPPVTVEDDTLSIVYLPRYAGELPGFLHFLALIIRRSNQETRQTEEMHTSSFQERQKAEFRQALKKLQLPK